MIIQERCCPNCFEQIGNRNECPYCHYNKMYRENNIALPLNMVLDQRYILGRILGSGGFGITYKAYDMQTRSFCAIKEYVPVGFATRSLDSIMLTASSSVHTNLFAHGKKRFIEEAQILSKLQYIPSIVKIKDCFLENGTAYFVMEFLEGVNLMELTIGMGGKLPFQTAYDKIHAVGKCLDAVHKNANIFHRDVSPENIFVKNDGQVVLIDFGTAKYINGKESQNLSVVLKHGYAPLEQYSSTGKQGTFTDVYALASTLYCVLTGCRIPSAPDRLMGKTYVKLEQLLKPQVLYKRLSEIVDRGLRLRSAERTQTVAEFIQALEEYKVYWDKHGRDPKSTIIIDKTQITKVDTNGETTKNIEEQDLSGNQNSKLTIPPEKRRFPYIDILSGEMAGFRYYIPSNMYITLGRSSTNSISLKDSSGYISKKHLQIFFEEKSEDFYVTEFSRNGTFVNGVLCKKNIVCRVRAGSTITLAKNVYTIRVGVESNYDE